MSILDKIRVLKRKGEDVTLGDGGDQVTLHLLPASVAMYPEMMEIVKPAIKSLARVWRGPQGQAWSADQRSVVQTMHDEETGQPIQIIETDAISPDLAKLRAAEKQEAVAEALEALLSDNAREPIGRLLYDALRTHADDFPQPVQTDKALEFINALQFSDLVELLVTFVKVNARVFGPLGKRMIALAREKMEGVLAAENLSTQSSNESDGSSPSSPPESEMS